MNWDDLRFFLALARARTMSSAGRALGVKHTTVARRIQGFEEKLGSRLFDHLVDGYAMTQAGEKLFQHALVMEEQVQQVDREIFGLDTQLQGKLKITAAHDVLNRLLIPQLGLFNRVYPGIELQLSSSTGLADLSAREADIALRLTPAPPDYLIGKKVLPLGVGLYASTIYLAKHHRLNQVVLWNSEKKQPDWVRQHFADASVAIRVNDVTSMAACATQHMGVARLPCYIADEISNLRRLDLQLSPSTWGVWVLSHIDLRDTARVRACREFLADILINQRSLICGSNSNYFN